MVAASVRSPADVGSAVRTARRRASLTQQQLAGMANVSRQLVVRLEQGDPTVTVRPALNVLEMLSLELVAVGTLTESDA